MRIPSSLPYLRAATLAFAAAALAWMSLEGTLWLDVALALAGLALALAHLLTRCLGGRMVAVGRFVAAAAAVGLVCGAALALLTLFLMTLKTGLHAHGPEYTPREIAWVWAQLPLWSGTGGLVGLGLSLLVVAMIGRN